MDIFLIATKFGLDLHTHTHTMVSTVTELRYTLTEYDESRTAVSGAQYASSARIASFTCSVSHSRLKTYTIT